MKILSGLLSLFLLIAALVFALSNRQLVTISFWPFDAAKDAPLSLVVLGPFFLGLLGGAVIAWFSFLPHRMAARRLRRELADLRSKVDGLHQTVIPPHANEDDDIPLLPRPKSRWPFRGTGS